MLCGRPTFNKLSWWAYVFSKLRVFDYTWSLNDYIAMIVNVINLMRVNPSETFHLLQSTCQLPVDTPQLRRHALFGAIEGSIFFTWAMSTTVYSLKLETDRKWYKTSPLRSVNLLVSYLGIHGDTLKGSFEHWLLFFDLQSTHSPQSDMNVGMTVSPSVTSSTSSPTLSTTLQHIKRGGNTISFHNLNAQTLNKPRRFDRSMPSNACAWSSMLKYGVSR